MDRDLLNEVVNLKEKRMMLRAECDSSINENLFSKIELNSIKKHRNDPHAFAELEAINIAIKEDEELLLES